MGVNKVSAERFNYSRNEKRARVRPSFPRFGICFASKLGLIINESKLNRRGVPGIITKSLMTTKIAR